MLMIKKYFKDLNPPEVVLFCKRTLINLLIESVIMAVLAILSSVKSFTFPNHVCLFTILTLLMYHSFNEYLSLKFQAFSTFSLFFLEYHIDITTDRTLNILDLIQRKCKMFTSLNCLRTCKYLTIFIIFILVYQYIYQNIKLPFSTLFLQMVKISQKGFKIDFRIYKLRSKVTYTLS